MTIYCEAASRLFVNAVMPSSEIVFSFSNYILVGQQVCTGSLTVRLYDYFLTVFNSVGCVAQLVECPPPEYFPSLMLDLQLKGDHLCG